MYCVGACDNLSCYRSRSLLRKRFSTNRDELLADEDESEEEDDGLAALYEEVRSFAEDEDSFLTKCFSL